MKGVWRVWRRWGGRVGRLRRRIEGEWGGWPEWMHRCPWLCKGAVWSLVAGVGIGHSGENWHCNVQATSDHNSRSRMQSRLGDVWWHEGKDLVLGTLEGGLRFGIEGRDLELYRRKEYIPLPDRFAVSC